MATREKTIRFGLPLLSSVADATVTNFTQIEVAIPETVVAFRSVQVQWFAADIITATGGTWTEFRTGLRVGAAGYTTVANLNDIANTGENLTAFISADMTAHFTTNWSGTTMTCDVQVYCDQSTGTTLGLRDVAGEIIITYSYDDTAATQIKTIMIPLATYVGASPTAKPGTAQALIPALDALPEASKTFRDCYIVFQANRATATTVDFTASHEIDATGVVTTGAMEQALGTDTWQKFIYSKFSGGAVSFTTSAAHNLYWWASVAKLHHPQAWIVITYEFDVASTTALWNSVLVPMEFASPAGAASALPNRVERELWIQEPGTITVQQCAAQIYWTQAAPMGTLGARLGTGGFTTFTDGASINAGGVGAQVMATPTLARGRNALNVDVYTTDTGDLGWQLSALVLINYTSGVPAAGPGAANHTIAHNLLNTSTVAAALSRVSASVAPTISASAYFITGAGLHALWMGSAASFSCHYETTAGEGGPYWAPGYVDVTHSDAEIGVMQAFATVRSGFRRWPTDPDTSRLSIETARTWRVVSSLAIRTHLDMLLTYHAITYAIAGTVTGSAGGTVTITAHRTASGEKIGETSRTGDGAYTLPWYDNTELVYTVARESGTLLARSDDGYAV